MVFDVTLWNAYQHYIACDAAVIPPVKGHGRDGIRGAGIVDFHHQEVVLLLYLICDFHLEGSESAFMTGYFLPVQIYFATVTYRTEIEKQTFAVSLWGIERASVPYSPFIKFQFGHL